MKNLKKKGFTIVELVIVIAVIAVLAAVLIPTFIHLTKKANESNDIQAVRNMNVYITSANISGEIKTPFDVFKIFEESGYEVENYKPLYQGRSFFYDVEKKCIVYVDDETDKILFPKEYEGESQGTNTWISIYDSVPVSSADKPEVYTKTNDKITATVTDGKEYAYVINEYNESADGTSLEIKVSGEMDLRGANISIEKTKGTVTITGENNAIIKNISSDKHFLVSSNNSSLKPAHYGAAALVVEAHHKIIIKDVIFDNLNINTPNVGNVGLLCGATRGENGCLEINNVTIQNSTVIGGRSVAALVGATPGGAGTIAVHLTGNLTLNNVKILTTQGRSALLVTTNSEKAFKIENNATINISSSTCRVYEDSRFDQTIVNEPTYNGQAATNPIVNLDGTTTGICYVHAIKNIEGDNEYSFYAHKDDVLVLQYGANAKRTAYMTVEELYANYK